MIAFIDEHREACGVEPVRRQLPIASSTYYARAAVARDPGLASDRARRDAKDLESIRRAHDGSSGRYGARKVWRQLRREKRGTARCTVERLMCRQGLQGVARGRKRTTIPRKSRLALARYERRTRQMFGKIFHPVLEELPACVGYQLGFVAHLNRNWPRRPTADCLTQPSNIALRVGFEVAERMQAKCRARVSETWSSRRVSMNGGSLSLPRNDRY